MTTTQAQIEAAANAIRIRLFEVGIDPVEGLAEAALTAAAGVGEQTKDDWLRRESDLIAQIERATIERCAQVVDGFEETRETRLIAAAIRSLKDS